METPRRDLSDLRSEAVAGLAELDVREVARLDLGPRAVISGLELIFGLDFSPDGRTVIGAGYTGSRFLWDWAGDRVTPLPDDPTMASVEPWSDQAALPGARSHPSGDYLATTTGDHRVILLGQQGRKPPVAALQGSGQPRGLAFDRRGRLLAVTWSDGRVVLYDAVTGTSRRELGPSPVGVFYRPVALSPDGERLAFAGPNFTVQVVDVTGAGRPRTVGRHGAQIRDLAFSPDGSRLASASEDRSAKVWEVGSGQELLTLQGHASQLTSLDWSPDGAWIATGGDDVTLRLWDARSGRLLMTVTSIIPESVRFSPDGSHLALAGTGIVMYELTGRAVSRLPIQGMRATAVAIHPKRPQLLATATSQGISLHDLRAGASSGPRTPPRPTSSSAPTAGDWRRSAAGATAGCRVRGRRYCSIPRPALISERSGPTRPSWLPSIPRAAGWRWPTLRGRSCSEIWRQTGRNGAGSRRGGRSRRWPSWAAAIVSSSDTAAGRS